MSNTIDTPRKLFGDWRDVLAVQRRGGEHPTRGGGIRIFEPIPLANGLKLSAQNSPAHHVSGRFDEPFDYLALEDFEIAFWREDDPGEEYSGLIKLKEDEELKAHFAAVGIDPKYIDTIWVDNVPAHTVAQLIERLR